MIASTVKSVSKLTVEATLPEEALEPISLGVRVANLLAVIVPLLGLVAAIIFLWGRGFSWVELGLLLGMYAVTIMGIGVGFHRLFTHRAFETNRVVEFILAALGSMAVQGPLLRWVATHRCHHQHSDQHGDPHSPHDHSRGILGVLRGLWHAHLGWMFQPGPPNLSHYVKDLRQSRSLRTASALDHCQLGADASDAYRAAGRAARACAHHLLRH